MSDDLPGISPEILAFDALIDAMILDIAIDMHWHLRCIQSQGIAATHRDFATNMTVGNRLPVTVSSNHASMPHGIAGNHRQDSTPSSKRSLETSETPIDGNETNDKRLPTGKITSASSSSSMSSISVGRYNMVKCPVCTEAVGGSRFAPHLEKCLKGKMRRVQKLKRPGEEPSPALSKRFDFPSIPTKPRVIKEIVDPHPQSLIIRIKMKDGVPYRNTLRMGATIEEFEKEEEEDDTIEESTNLKSKKRRKR